MSAAATPGFRGRAVERPLRRALAQPVRVARVRRQERLVGVAVLEQVAVNRQRHRQIGARLHRQVQVGLLGERRRPRIDDHERRAALLRLAQVRDDVNPGRRRIDAPQDDEARLGEVLIDHRRHLAVERLVGGPGGRRAHGAREARGAEAPEQRGVARVLRQQPVRPAVRVGQDGFAAELRPSRRADARRCGPSASSHDTRSNQPLPFGPLRTRRMQHAIGAVHALGETADLGADVAACHRIGGRTVYDSDLALLHGHVEAAGVGAVERTDGRDGMLGGGRSLQSHGSVLLVRATGLRIGVSIGARRAACRHPRWRLRRPGRRQGARASRRPGDARRSPQLPSVSAAALPGGHGDAVGRRHRRSHSLGAAPRVERPRAAWRGARRWT